ncbi:MAG: tyrosine-type recombinase/integrase [Chloroflexi bacterium]|nr:tyrosine-type recombinase/integrase [Chloroflexota bacterium]
MSQGIQEFLEHKRAERLSPRTLEDYEGTLQRFANVLDKTEIKNIDIKDIRKYLASLSVSKKRVKNIHITLSSFWTWAVNENVCDIHVPRLIKPPKPEKRIVVPITKFEIEAMLGATEISLPYKRAGKRLTQIPLKNGFRDKAIIFFLLDTGVRASEFCQLRMGDVTRSGAFVHGKGAKDRIVPLSQQTRERVHAYTSLLKRAAKDFVFLTQNNDPLTRDSLREIITRVAKRAGVSHIHPHKFRHTFAINFLRNGGDIFSLQMILGHETLDMVKRYLAIAQLDIQSAHRKASPIIGWGLGSS